MRNTLISMVTVATLSISFTGSFARAGGKKSDDFFAKIDPKYITIKPYSEVMKLSRADRTLYVDRIRALVIELETMQPKKAKMLGSAREFNRLDAYLRVLDLMSATAEAKDEKKQKSKQLQIQVLTPEELERQAEADLKLHPMPESKKLDVGLPPAPKAKPAKPTAAKPAAAKTDTVSVTGPSGAAPEAAAPAPSTAAAADPTAEKCEIPGAPGASCSDASIRSARDKYYALSRKDCIYAGNLTSYTDGVKKPGSCDRPSKFCVESPDCKSASGDAHEPKFACQDGEVICNPLLYSVKKDGGGPFCISHSATATKDCTEASTEATREPDFLGKDIPGLKEAWDTFAHQFNGLCFGDAVAKKFFCRECYLIKTRLLEMEFGSQKNETCAMAKYFRDETDPKAKDGEAPPAVIAEPVRGQSTVK